MIEPTLAMTIHIRIMLVNLVKLPTIYLYRECTRIIGLECT